MPFRATMTTMWKPCGGWPPVPRRRACIPEHALITRYGMKLSLSHYPKYALREARSGNADAALYGHTHQAVSERCGGCLLANPGELQGRTGRIGFGVLDTDTRIINLHNLDFYAP